MNRVIHFEIHAEDCERAKKFYEQVFEWKYEDYSSFTDGEEYWGIITGDGNIPGIDGGLLKSPCSKPKEAEGINAYVCSIVVDNYDESEKKILAAGGKKSVEKFEIKDMAWQGYFIDTEGNTFGIHQPLNSEYFNSMQ